MSAALPLAHVVYVDVRPAAARRRAQPAEVLAYTVDMVLAKRTTADEARGIGEPCRVMEKNMELRSGAGSHGPRRQS